MVGNVSSMQIKSNDALGNETVSTVTNQRLFVNPGATYAEVDTFARKLNGLTNNTYKDTDLITIISVNEKLADE